MNSHKPTTAIAVTIIAVIGWLIYVLLHTIYWWNNFSWIQNIIIYIVTLLIAGAFIGLMWIFYPFKRE